jgi:hypothetical protein
LSDSQFTRQSIESNATSQAYGHYDDDNDDDDDHDDIDEAGYDADDDDNDENLILKQTNMKNLEKKMKNLINTNYVDPTQSNALKNLNTQKCKNAKQNLSIFCKLRLIKIKIFTISGPF